MSGSRVTLLSLVFLALVAGFALRSCERETNWRQRLTIVVETPGGEVRGGVGH